MLNELEALFSGMDADTAEAFARALIDYAVHAAALQTGDETHRDAANRAMAEMVELLS